MCVRSQSDVIRLCSSPQPPPDLLAHAPAAVVRSTVVVRRRPTLIESTASSEKFDPTVFEDFDHPQARLGTYVTRALPQPQPSIRSRHHRDHHAHGLFRWQTSLDLPPGATFAVTQARPGALTPNWLSAPPPWRSRRPHRHLKQVPTWWGRGARPHLPALRHAWLRRGPTRILPTLAHHSLSPIDARADTILYICQVADMLLYVLVLNSGL